MSAPIVDAVAPPDARVVSPRSGEQSATRDGVADSRSGSDGSGGSGSTGAAEATATPWGAISLSVAGVLLMAFVAFAAPNDHTLDIAVSSLRLPKLPGPASTYLTCAAIAAQGAGLIRMLAANRRGWSPSPKRLVGLGAFGALLLAVGTPVGSADTASYAAYGRIASLGLDPYRTLPGELGGSYAHLVGNNWLFTPSVYGPLATFVQQLAADIGGSRLTLTITVLMLANAAAYVLTGLVLVRMARDRSRAALLWAANPLLLCLLVGGGHLDTYIALFSACAAYAALRVRESPASHEMVVGALLGMACGVKISAALVAVGLSWPLLREREWKRLIVRTVSCLVPLAVMYVPIGIHGLDPLSQASQLVSSPSVWALVDLLGRVTVGQGVTEAVITLAWPVAMLAMGWIFYRRTVGHPAELGLEQPRGAYALALGWLLAAPWCMPWYAALVWPLAAVLPSRRRADLLLTWFTLGLALFHNTGGHGWSW
ncbi:hypothetical protein [Streptacidiphilus fuscans]|uniref:DUF2029 domain-containing protein n=1 Tax=Streptacidiphilus fuscans TaxID=2789292 RepID=A0A931FER3_9ACTN|nr:hypothetical protein [Streptacidiphilus fuscans]MBF9068946.1 hypothetical protein [Streptacidiphilus fuscans]MBF9073400.1 hypothetical protein [Streptacidiphilus fuscans]